LPCANRLEQTKARVTAMMSDKRFIVPLLPKNFGIGQLNSCGAL
jgi:hypothetical protein